MLASGASAAGDIQVENTSQMSAAKCLVQSNGNFTADAGASVTAELAQATGTASGPITPAPQTGAPAIADPFASMTITPPLLGICLPLNLTAGDQHPAARHLLRRHHVCATRPCTCCPASIISKARA